MGHDPVRSVGLFLIFLVLFSVNLNPALLNRQIYQPLVDIEKQKLTVHLRYLHSADEALLQKKFGSALANYFKYLTYAPGDKKSLAWDDLGFIYLMTGKPERARTYLEDAVKAASVDFNPRFYLAVADLLLDDFDAAARHIEAIETDVYFDDAWLKAVSGFSVMKRDGCIVPQSDLDLLRPEKGVHIEKDGGMEEDSSLILYPDAFDEQNIPVYFVIRGVLLREQGRESESHASFQSAMMQTAHPDILCPVVEKLSLIPPIQDPSGSHEEMIEALSELLPIISHTFHDHPTNILWQISQDFLKELRKGHLEEAENILRLGLTVNEESFAANHNLALLSYDEGDLDTASHYGVRTVFFHPDSVEALDLLGNILYRKRDFEMAREYFSRALDLEPDNSFCLYTCGCCDYYLGESDSAEECWTRAVTLAPGPLESNAEKIEETQLSHEMTVRSRTVLFLSLKALGSLCLEQNRFQKAGEYLRKAISLRSEDPEIMFMLGKALACVEGEPSPESVREAVSLLERHIHLGGKHTAEAADLLNVLREKIKHL